jgi:hypothetical protein
MTCRISSKPIVIINKINFLVIKPKGFSRFAIRSFCHFYSKLLERFPKVNYPVYCVLKDKAIILFYLYLYEKEFEWKR